MPSLPRFAVGNPVLIHLLMVLVCIAGIFAYRSMPKDQFPDASMAAFSVATVMPGASPKEVEQLLTIPLEEELAKMDDVDSMTSTSSEGISMIFVQFDADTDRNFELVTDAQNKINQVPRFPEDAEPSLIQIARPPFFTATIVILGNAPEHELKIFTDDLEEAVKNTSGVAEVRVSGIREREVWVQADPNRLYSYGLSLNDLATALRSRNLNLPGGNIQLDRGKFTVRTEAEFQDLEQIRNTIVRRSQDEGQQGYVYIRDVATVVDTFEDRFSLSRLDGDSSISLVINKNKTSNTITLVEDLYKVMDEFETRLPAGTELKLVDDASIEIRNRLAGLFSNLGIGLALVVLTISMFIGRRAALMVAAGIPIAFLATFVLINAYGMTINTLVLFSLILVIGLVVDDAIVVCENIYRHYENGMSLVEASVKGTEQIIWPVTATVMTTVAAFLPLLIMGGILGDFMGVIPVVVTFALISSLGEAFLILPVHVAELGGKGNHRGIENARPWLHKLTETYKRLLRFMLRFRYPALAAVILLAMFCVFLATNRMDFILFGGRDIEAFSVAIEAPPAAAIEETARIVREVEGAAIATTQENNEADSVRSEIGFLTRGGGFGQSGTHLAQVTVDLVDLNERVRSGADVRDELRDTIKDVTGVRAISIEEAREGPPVGKAVSLRVVGDNFDTLKEISGEIQAFLRGIEGVKDVVDDFPPGRDEVRPVLNLEKIASIGLDVQTIATEIRGAFEGIEATRVYDGNEEVEVMVKYNEENRRSLSNLETMQFATPQGMVPFSNVATLERLPGVSQINHYGQSRAITVSADVERGVATSTDVNRQLIEEFSDLNQNYPGYNLSFGGEFEDTQESVASMFRAFAISIVLIYVILGGLFRSFLQPLIVMCSVPFAFIGVVLGFYLLQEPLGMFSVIGTIALSGIVVNDSLIMIDFINRKRAEGLGELDSIVVASSMRLRPILLTSITTVAGLLPIAVGLFGVDRFLKPMAIAISCGLIFSTFLCLIMIPCVYRIFDDLSKLVLKRPLASGSGLEDHGLEDQEAAVA